MKAPEPRSSSEIVRLPKAGGGTGGAGTRIYKAVVSVAPSGGMNYFWARRYDDTTGVYEADSEGNGIKVYGHVASDTAVDLQSCLPEIIAGNYFFIKSAHVALDEGETEWADWECLTVFIPTYECP